MLLVISRARDSHCSKLMSLGCEKLTCCDAYLTIPSVILSDSTTTSLAAHEIQMPLFPTPDANNFLHPVNLTC
ncbi:MFS transporter [Fusarium oxysporum f. sp. albedinis]|nr:MFS transporter [Fusarium oxysporum f. sp. albedinis]